jgi:lysine-N-methylase
VTLPLRTLSIEERWDCHGCAVCCRGSIIPLGGQDLQQLRQQGWHEHPDFRGVRIMARQGWLKRAYRLAQGPDGRCVFLTDDGLCRIHKEHGESAKPLVCRRFPFQLVPLEKHTLVTVRRSCPSAAAGRGRPVKEHLKAVRRLAEQRGMAAGAGSPPPITRGQRRSWRDFLRVAETIERLMLDGRYPHVRRLAHALEFCGLLEQCRVADLAGAKLAELLSILEASAVSQAAEAFRDRRQPGRLARMFFRQTALEHARLHPKVRLVSSWHARWRMAVTAVRFAWGRGRVPHIDPHFPPAKFEELDRPLGHLGADVLDPLAAYLETAAVSKHYALLGRRRWPLVESFRALALTHAVAMWLLRLSCGGRPPQAEDTIDAVAAIERGQGYAALTGRRHRRHVASLTRLQALVPLVVWHAR